MKLTNKHAYRLGFHTLTKLDNLITEYQTWCDNNGFPQLSADELFFEVELTDEQKSYVENFIERWDAVEQEAE